MNRRRFLRFLAAVPAVAAGAAEALSVSVDVAGANGDVAIAEAARRAALISAQLHRLNLRGVSIGYQEIVDKIIGDNRREFERRLQKIHVGALLRPL